MYAAHERSCARRQARPGRTDASPDPACSTPRLAGARRRRPRAGGRRSPDRALHFPELDLVRARRRHEVELWLPLPREDGQAVREMTLAGSGRAIVVPLSAAGDRAAYVRVAEPAGPVTLRLTATVARHEIGS